jgi:hypothetical protein
MYFTEKEKYLPLYFKYKNKKPPSQAVMFFAHKLYYGLVFSMNGARFLFFV